MRDDYYYFYLFFLNLAGKLVEYDPPMKLMNEEGSLFGQLVKEYWAHSNNANGHLEDEC